MTAKSNEIINALKANLESAGFTLVTRRKLGISEIAKNEFNAVIIQEGSNFIEAQGVNGQVTRTRWQVSLKLCVVSNASQSAREVWYEQAALIGRTIATDRQLSGAVESVAIDDRSLDAEVYEPFASGSLGLTIRYRYNDLTQGG